MHRRRSTIFKKWDLLLTFPAIYKVHMYVTAHVPGTSYMLSVLMLRVY